MSRKPWAIVALLSFNLIGCSLITSEGLENIVACRLETAAAARAVKGALYDLNTFRTTMPVDLPKKLRAIHGADIFYPAHPNTYVFGSKVIALGYFAMHESAFFVVVAEGEIDAMKRIIERHGSLRFQEQPASEDFVFVSETKNIENGVSIYKWKSQVTATSFLRGTFDKRAYVLAGCSWSR